MIADGQRVFKTSDGRETKRFDIFKLNAMLRKIELALAAARSRQFIPADQESRQECMTTSPSLPHMGVMDSIRIGVA
jgi:hypothetical protein